MSATARVNYTYARDKKLLKENYIKVDEFDDGRIKLSVTADAPVTKKKYTNTTHYDSEGNFAGIIKKDEKTLHFRTRSSDVCRVCNRCY